MNILNLNQAVNKFYDYFEVPQFTLLAVGITFTNIEFFMKMLSLFLAASYTLWKWRNDIEEREKKKAQEENRPFVKKPWYKLWRK